MYNINDAVIYFDIQKCNKYRVVLLFEQKIRYINSLEPLHSNTFYLIGVNKMKFVLANNSHFHVF